MYHAEGYLELLPTLKKKEKHVKSVCRPSGQAITKEGRGDRPSFVTTHQPSDASSCCSSLLSVCNTPQGDFLTTHSSRTPYRGNVQTPHEPQQTPAPPIRCVQSRIDANVPQPCDALHDFLRPAPSCRPTTRFYEAPPSGGNSQWPPSYW